MTNKDEPRELTPVQMFWDPNSGVKDMRPLIQKVDPDEAREVEEAITPAPKEESALASAASSGSQLTSAPVVSETPALPANVTPTEKLEAAVKASGKPSGSSEAEPPSESPTSPKPESSSPDSSSEDQTKSGKPAPPVVPKPPTSAPTPTQ